MSFLTLRALLFVAECLLASLLLPLLGFAAARLVHRAALRHLVWLTMFGVLALLPLAALLLPANRIVLPPAAPVAEAAPVESIALPPVETMEPLPEAPGERRIVPLNFKVDLQSAPAMAAPASAPATVSAEPWLTSEKAPMLLVLLWAAGLAWNLGRMALGTAGLSRLRRESELLESRDAFDVRLSRNVTGPATFGILRPLVLLPEAARQWSAARRDAVLAHEAAHVVRHDIASQTLARLVCAVFWFNPLLWLAARALRREAEIAADDAVLAGGMTPSAYAAELVALAGEILKPAPTVRILGAGMADSPLMSRVQSVLNANISRKGVSGMDMARMVALGLAATLLLATARIDLALAQDAPAQAAQAAPAAKPTPAAPPARGAAPKIDIEINRELAPKPDVEVEAIKARAAADRARRQIDALAADSARALAAVEEARKAAQAVAGKQIRRAMAGAASGADAVGAARSLAAIEQAEAAARDVANARIGDAMRQRVAQSEQQMKETQQRASEAGQRALEAKAQADEAQRRAEDAQRRLEREKQSLLAPLSDEEKAAFAAARQLKITVSPVEVQVRLRAIENALGLQQTDQLRDRVLLDLAREKMAELQAASTLDQQTETRQGALEPETRARAVPANIRTNAEDVRQRMGPVKAMMLRQLSDEAVLAAASQQKISVLAAEVNERVRLYMMRTKLVTETAKLRDQAELDLFREKIALLQSKAPPPPQIDLALMDRPQPFMETKIDGRSVTNYLVRRYLKSNDFNVTATIITPFFGTVGPDTLAKLNAVIDAAMADATRKIDAAHALMPRAKLSEANAQIASLVRRGNRVIVTLDVYGPRYDTWLENNAADFEASLKRRNDAVMASLAEVTGKIDTALAAAPKI